MMLDGTTDHGGVVIGGSGTVIIGDTQGLTQSLTTRQPDFAVVRWTV